MENYLGVDVPTSPTFRNLTIYMRITPSIDFLKIEGPMGWGWGRDLAILEYLELPNHNPGEGVVFKTMPLGKKYRVS